MAEREKEKTETNNFFLTPLIPMVIGRKPLSEVG
jgi:hypothetical protein